MAQIINHNPEDNPRLNEIYEILLLAGYFRIRIASLKAFDKITGGIAWCITSSNFQIEIEYNDQMQIGQKIKVSQVICHSLQEMKCPYSLQPFQLQGLDVNGIFPVVQWLVKFVYETREQRQKYDRSLSLLLGKNITKLQPKGNQQKVEKVQIKRSRINKAISQISYHHPVRVYSALLQYKDASATKMYHKLLNIITKNTKKKKQIGEKKEKTQQMVGYLQEEEAQDHKVQQMNEFGDLSNFSLERLQKIIEQNKKKYDRSLSLLLGKNITKLQPKGNQQKVEKVQIKRSRINKAISQISYHHPVRVYSALLQYKDASATKMYHKLLNIITKNTKKKKQTGEKKEKTQQMVGYLEEEEAQDHKVQQMNEFGDLSNFSLERLQKIIEQNKQNLQQGIKEGENEEIKIEYSSEQVSEKQETKEENKFEKKNKEKQKIIRNLKKENQNIYKKILAIENQVASYQTMERKLEEELNEVKERHENHRQKAVEEIQTNKQYKALGREISENLKTRKELTNSKLEKLVEKRLALKNKKTELKKKAKAKIEELNNEKNLVQASIPEIDEEAFGEMMKEAQMKKEIFDKKYEQLTLVNQQLAVLQRKAENITSAPEIVQYHQRFIELFESINILIEEKRGMYSQMDNLESSKKMMMNYLDILKNLKEEYLKVKKRNELKELVEGTGDIMKALEENMKNSMISVEKARSKRQSVYGQLMDLIKLERQYLQLMRDLKIQYQNAAKYYK